MAPHTRRKHHRLLVVGLALSLASCAYGYASQEGRERDELRPKPGVRVVTVDRSDEGVETLPGPEDQGGKTSTP